jgi:hypothetical protein
LGNFWRTSIPAITLLFVHTKRGQVTIPRMEISKDFKNFHCPKTFFTAGEIDRTRYG